MTVLGAAARSRGSRGHRGAVVLAAVVLLVVAAAGGLAAVVSPRAGTVRRSFPAPASLLVVTADAARVTVAAGGNRRVEVERTITPGLLRPQVVERLDGDRLTLAASCPAPEVACAASYRLRVPAGLDVQLAATGEVQVAGATGALDVRAGGGRVTVDGAGGRVRLRAPAAELVGRGLRAGDVTATTGRGRVELGFARPPEQVEVRTGTGDVHLRLPAGRARYRVDAHADRRVWVEVPTRPDAERRLTALTGDGTVTITRRSLK